MKRILCIVAAFVAAGLLAYAGDIEENTTPKPFKYEVRLGWSGYPMTSLLTESEIHLFRSLLEVPKNVSDLYKDGNGPLRSTANIGVEFDFILKRWLTLSVGVYGEGVWRTAYDGMTGSSMGVKHGALVAILPQARFTYLSKERVKLYSAAGVGLAMGGIQGDSFHCIPTFQTVPFGVTVGRRFFGFGELGLGLTYCGINAGIGYRF